MGRDPLDYLGVPDATTTVKGKVELATTAETVTGTATNLVCTPAGVAAVAIAGAPDASEGTKGIAQLATSAEATTGTNDAKIMTPLKVANKFASPGAIGGTTAAAGTFTDLTADGTGTVTLTSNAASVYDVTGAGNDLTLSSDAGRVIINGEEAAANAITLLSAAGGIDADAALQVNIATSQSANDALVLTASAGGIDILASGAAAGEDIDIAATGSSVNISASENVADAITMNASAGGIDITAAGAAGEDLDLVCTSGSANLSGGEDAADAVVISAGAGGIDILATGEAGQDIDIANTGGSVNISATEDNNGAIYIRANGGTSERIRLHADQGTAVDSVLLDSDAGGITLTAALASDDAINLNASAGGVDIDGALQVNIASSENAADAVRINASAGGIDIDAAGAAGEDINIANAAGSVVMSAGEAIADSMKFESTAGGIDILASGAGAGLDIDIVNTGGSVNVSATESANDAIKVEATAGGIDILASGAAAGEDIDIVATGSSVNIQSTEADGAAITINASNAAGGMLLDSGGVLELNSSGGVISIGNDAVAQNINIGTGAAAREVTVGNSTGASGLTLVAGTGNIATTGTFEAIDAKYVVPTGIDITLNQSPVMQTNATTGGAATGATGDINLMALQDGIVMEQFILGAGQTIISPRMDANGLNIALDQVDNEGAEYNFGARNNAKHAFTIGTSAAFQMEATFKVADVSGCEPLMMGFRKVEANNATITSYTDYACIGLDNVAAAGNVVISTELNSGGTTNTDTTDAWADAASHKLSVLVSAAGVVTFQIDGGAPSATQAYTFDNADVVMPFIHFLNGADVAGDVQLVDLKIGFQ